MTIKETTCKSALSSSTLPGLTYSLNPYKGCSHRCAYCYVPNVLRIPREQWGIDIEVKKNIPMILAKELKTKPRGVVGISTVTDPYQPLEKKYNLTRSCLQQLLSYDFPVCIQTKSSLMVRDLDLLSRFSQAEVMVSIGSLHEEEIGVLEPNASPIQERLQVLTECANIGVKTTVFFGPVYPTTRVEEIPWILETFKAHQVSEVMIDTLNLKPGIFENISKYLTNHKEIYNIFKENTLKNREWYHRIREEIKSIGRKMSLPVIDAFEK